MATRPIFLPDPDNEQVVREISIEFTWHPGLSVAQKRRSVQSLHLAAEAKGIQPLLEISGAAPHDLGRSLSAFSLLLSLPGHGRVPVECAFQGSKIFEDGGPYQDLYDLSPREAKTHSRLRSSGHLISFRLLDVEWPSEPKTAFYDWLYLSALLELGSDADRLLEFQGFTDIQFNPAKSLNCQARSAALYVALRRSGRLTDAMTDQLSFLAVVGNKPTSTARPAQPSLFSDL